MLDISGIHIFGSQGKFLRMVKAKKLEILDTTAGLCENENGELLTINRCLKGDVGLKTSLGNTDIFHVNLEKEAVVKRFEMEDIIEDIQSSNCSNLAIQVNIRPLHLII